MPCALYHSWHAHVPCMPSACTTHAKRMHHACHAHAPRMPCACITHATCMHLACNMHAPCMQHACTMRKCFSHVAVENYNMHVNYNMHMSCMKSVRNPCMLHETCMYINMETCMFTCMLCMHVGIVFFACNMHAACMTFRAGIA